MLQSLPAVLRRSARSSSYVSPLYNVPPVYVMSSDTYNNTCYNNLLWGQIEVK